MMPSEHKPEEVESPREEAATEAAGQGSPPAGEGAAPADAEETLRLLEDARARADETWDQVLRLQAELENARKRFERDLESAHRFGVEKLVKELLPVRDSLEKGLEAADAEQADVAALREGTALTLRLLTQALERFGVREVDPAGQRFDPELHQAMSVQQGTQAEPNTVLHVMQKGYTLNDRLVRPALVVVAK